MRRSSDQGTPVPMDEPLAANPPEGAVVDYSLKDRPRSPIQLEIFDSDGKLVRRFASDEVLRKTNPTTSRFKSSGYATRNLFWPRRECTDSCGIFITRCRRVCAAPSGDRPGHWQSRPH